MPEIPSKATVAAQLLEALATLLQAEQNAVEAAITLSQQRRQLQWEEDAGRPSLEGKNEGDRASELRRRTATTRGYVEQAEDAHRRAASALEAARATVGVYKALARLLAGDGA